MSHTLTVILRSIFVGFASLVGAVVIGIPIGILAALAYQRTQGFGGGEVGWDLVTLAHDRPILPIPIPLAVFMLGSYFGYRQFSR